MMIKVNVKGCLATGFARKHVGRVWREKRRRKGSLSLLLLVFVMTKVAVGNEKNSGILFGIEKSSQLLI